VNEVKLTEDQAKNLESFVSDHMMACSTYIYEEGAELPEGWEPYGVYDGCEVCDTREQLMATFDWLRTHKLVDIFVG
jgi:hypothetical protein